MFCNKCGKQIPDTSAFCPFCGEKIETGTGANYVIMPDVISTAKKSEKKLSSKMIAIIAAAVVLVAAVIGIIVYSSQIAPIKNAITEFNNSSEAEAICSAYEKLVEFADAGKESAQAELPAAQEKVYNAAVECYNNSELDDAKSLFNLVSDYEDSNNYLFYIKARTADSYSGDIKNGLLARIKDKEAKNIILQRFFYDFLEGTWADGKGYYFTMYQHSAKWNLPYTSLSHSYFTIDNGQMYFYDKDLTEEQFLSGNFDRVDCFKFEILAANEISIYCYNGGKTFTMKLQATTN